LHRTTLGAALCLVTAVVEADEPKRQEYYRTETRHLDNGMTVIVEEDHRLPLVAARIVYDTGDGAAAPGSEGVASLTSALMADGTEHVPRDEYQRLIAQAGGINSSDWTSTTSIALWVTVPSNRVSLPLWLWSDQMGFFDKSLDDARVETHKKMLHQRRRTALEGAPLVRLDQFAAEEVFPAGHPSHGGWFAPEDADRLDRAAVVAFHDRWITPRHATLVLVGDVTAADGFALAQRYFGTIPAGASDERITVPPDKPLDGETTFEVAADVPHARVSIRWRTPKLLTLPDAHLDVVARLLAGGRTAWLYWKLVDELKVATNVTARQRSGGFGSQFDIEVEAAGSKTAAELLTAFDAAMDAARARPVQQQEIEGAVYETLIDRVLGLERAPTRAAEHAKFATLVGTPDYFRHDFARYERIAPSTVRQTFETWLPRDRRVVMLVTPTPHAAAGGEKTARRFVKAGSP
jgi:zinc protease